MSFTITYARKWYEFEYTARSQKDGLFTLSCRVIGPDGYYVAHRSYTRKDVARDEIDRIFGL